MLEKMFMTLRNQGSREWRGVMSRDPKESLWTMIGRGLGCFGGEIAVCIQSNGYMALSRLSLEKQECASNLLWVYIGL